MTAISAICSAGLNRHWPGQRGTEPAFRTEEGADDILDTLRKSIKHLLGQNELLYQEIYPRIGLLKERIPGWENWQEN
jgi:hypothetical protein